MIHDNHNHLRPFHSGANETNHYLRYIVSRQTEYIIMQVHTPMPMQEQPRPQPQPRPQSQPDLRSEAMVDSLREGLTSTETMVKHLQQQFGASSSRDRNRNRNSDHKANHPMPKLERLQQPQLPLHAVPPQHVPNSKDNRQRTTQLPRPCPLP